MVHLKHKGHGFNLKMRGFPMSHFQHTDPSTPDIRAATLLRERDPHMLREEEVRKCIGDEAFMSLHNLRGHKIRSSNERVPDESC